MVVNCNAPKLVKACVSWPGHPILIKKKLRKKKQKQVRKLKDIGSKHTSWPLPLTTSGALICLPPPPPFLINGVFTCFFPKSYKDLALSTSSTVLRRIGTVPFGHLSPFLCHVCHATIPSLVVLPFSSLFNVFDFGLSGGCLCNIQYSINSFFAVQKHNNMHISSQGSFY